MVWVRHGGQDGIDVIEELGPAEREMLLTPGVEYDEATIEIADLGIVSHETIMAKRLSDWEALRADRVRAPVSTKAPAPR